MPSTVTATGKVGPAGTVTSQVYNDVVRLEYLCAPKSILFLQFSNGKIQELDISAGTTWTTTLSAGSITVTIS